MMILLVFALPTRGQELAGTFTGTVTDTTGAVIPHALVTITLNGVDGNSRVVQSNDSGNYTATNLPAGTYTITVSVPSFEKFSDRNVILNVAQKRTVNVQLKAGSQSQTVTVEDNPVTVETESSSQAGTISGTQLREPRAGQSQLSTVGYAATGGCEPARRSARLWRDQ
ncbi:carboxypeptidase-like regulatory domain-containing protein [Tunturiibacter empetritectus]|uniref:carboxypeptidase-like regulatory domain-containing protein n=1 Tax=Tunturiibacter empetritectus TaxID=3069691 RepID=UPI003D9B0486